jgi:hypothetical protein
MGAIQFETCFKQMTALNCNPSSQFTINPSIPKPHLFSITLSLSNLLLLVNSKRLVSLVLSSSVAASIASLDVSCETLVCQD